MENETDKVPPPNNGERGASRAIIFLIVAFLPAVAGLVLMKLGSMSVGGFQLLIFFNVVCSLVSSIGLTRGTKIIGVRVLTSLLLVPAFFLMNAIIVVFVGCNGGIK